MKIELTDKQALVLRYILERVDKCLEKDDLFGVIMVIFFVNLNQARNVRLIEF